MSRPLDPTLYLVTDRPLCGGRDLREVVLAAVRGGVTLVQLREKSCDTREYVELARDLRGPLREAGVPLLINDRVDVAVAAGADGVHLGQSDLPWPAARRLLGAEALIGLSVESPEQATAAADADVDYLGVSPIFATPTKTDTAGEWGLDGLRRLRAATDRRLVAIGGLSRDNAAAVVAAGADGVAVVSAICAAADPEAAARELRAAIDGARRERP